MKRPCLPGITLVELLTVLGIIAILVALLLPMAFRARKQADISVCISNLRQLLMAAKMYEADWGVLPVHMGTQPSEYWVSKIDPYVKSKDDIFICPSDHTNGKEYRWGDGRLCSYIFFYTKAHLGPGGSYRQPKSSSPMVGCRWHEGYQMVMARYDGSVELAPSRRYLKIGVQFDDE